VAKTSTQLEQLVSAIHRRWVIWRAVERGGVGVLVGCALAAVLYPILLWRGEPTMPMIVGAIGLGAICGLLSGLHARPTRLNAAIEADRQLKLHDLLSSAISVERTRSDEWSAAVIAMAEAKCHSIAPRDVILNRLGVRVWGGIGLATAIVLVLGVLSSNPIVTQAVANLSGRSPAVANSSDATERESPLASASASSPVHHPEAKDATHTQIPEPVDSGQATTEDRSSAAHSDSANGTGAGTAKTEQRLTSPLASSASPAGSNDLSGTRTASGGAANPHARSGEDNASANVSPSAAANVPAWQSPSWPTAREQALRDVRDRKTPPEYNDLIRDYFNRDGVDH
jgi:hypothetical protein